MEQPISINNYLIEILKSHNIEIFEEKDGWIIFPKRSIVAPNDKSYFVRSPKLAGEIVNISQHPTFTNVQLDILVEIFDGRVLIESFAGIGNSQDEAISNSLENFIYNSLHVLLNAFYDVKDEQISDEKWQINGKNWQAIIGGFAVKKFEEIPVKVPETVFPTFENLIKRQTLFKDVHWFRLFYAQQNKKFLDCETLFDNDIWSEANKELEKLDWESAESYYSVRNFLILKNDSFGKLKNFSEFTDSVIKSVETFRDNPRKDEEFLIQNLVNQGIDKKAAGDLVDFIPIAFTRVGLEPLNVNFQDFVQFVDKKGNIVEKKKLLDIPIYIEAVRFAKEDAGLFIDNDEFLTIESYNAEFKVINDMLNKGSRIEDLVISPVTMLAGNDVIKDSEENKSWWQIWK